MVKEETYLIEIKQGEEIKDCFSIDSKYDIEKLNNWIKKFKANLDNPKYTREDLGF